MEVREAILSSQRILTLNYFCVDVLGESIEKNLPAEYAPSEKDPRVSHPNADARGKGDPCPKAPEGPSKTEPLVAGAKKVAIERTFRVGRKLTSRHLVVWVCPASEESCGMLAVVVSRRKHGGAVSRNRVRRRVTEAVRTAGGIAGFDSVWLPTPAVKDLSSEALRGELCQILENMTK